MADLDLDALGILQADRLVITLTLRGRHLLEEREICRLRIRCNDDRFRARRRRGILDHVPIGGSRDGVVRRRRHTAVGAHLSKLVRHLAGSDQRFTFCS